MGLYLGGAWVEDAMRKKCMQERLDDKLGFEIEYWWIGTK